MEEVKRIWLEVKKIFGTEPQLVMLSSLSPMAIGGPGLRFRASSESYLSDILRKLSKNKIRYVPIGGCSNILCPDEPLEAPIITLIGDFCQIVWRSLGSGVMRLGGGASLAKCVRVAQKVGLSGLAPLSGLPGTVGGAVRGNAGSFGQSIGELVERLYLLTPEGREVVLERAELNFDYRRFTLPKGLEESLIYCLLIKLKPSSSLQVAIEGNEAKRSRELSQPKGRSLGCFFKNPPGDSAGRLIDSLGLKGLKVGGAIISDIHANFILNVEKANQKDVLELALKVKDLVLKKTGLKLIPEVKIIDSQGLEMSLD
ncbi:MAG: UDP-N-acetylmuramate dehydrogenase [Deltaproteobacteria bacterium]|jgi:UDP-N-acetylmuramate dehydrogenase|nr:UDP-N-acetylmuramate dehydrogenase [Deltaproteobacteria bacterium]